MILFTSVTPLQIGSRVLRRISSLCLIVGLLLLACFGATGGPPRVLPEGKLPQDVRLRPLKDLDGYFPFVPPKGKEEWAQRAELVRRQILVSQGLWPLPPKTPLNPVIHGKIDRGDYTVEKVYFESHPGFFVTGNLYRPKGRSGKLAGVLSPHGHWPNGRFYDQGEAGVRQQIVQGAERFEEGGRSPLQARCMQLARMGCVVFHYDMLGNADSLQLSHELVHRFAKQRPEMNTLQDWGFYSPQAEAHAQSIMGLQTWNSIRALDFLETLPEVDAKRIAVTGASGGGTQTMLLAAVDPRVAVSVPAVMVSTAMQGGCTCENASLLRVDTGNIEFAALFAPKPQAMTCADDWTKEMSAKGFPELQQLYKLLGAPANVHLIHGEHFKHNYNYVSRAAMYVWVNRHFKLGFKEPIVEEDFKRLTQEEMSVWDAQHPKPPSGPDFERKLARYLTDTSERQITTARQSPEEYRRIVGGGFEAIFGRKLVTAGETEFALKDKHERGGYLEESGLLRNKTHGEELPMVFLHPKDWKGQTVIWADGSGKAALYGADGKPRAEVQSLLSGGAAVVGVDLAYQGEFLADGKPMTRTGRVKNPREFAGYTFGYNHTVFAHRVHDLLTVVAYVQHPPLKSKSIDLLGVNGAGALVAAARALSADAVKRVAADTGGFRFGKLLDFHDPNFLPGGAKYDDVPGLLAINAPNALWVAGEGKKGLDVPMAIYALAGAGSKLTLYEGALDKRTEAAVKWLLQTN